VLVKQETGVRLLAQARDSFLYWFPVPPPFYPVGGKNLAPGVKLPGLTSPLTSAEAENSHILQNSFMEGGGDPGHIKF
jgi:hypothetical protein